MWYEIVATFMSPDEERKVEVFRRADHTYGFEELQYCPADELWLPVAQHSAAIFDSEQGARQEARERIAWVACAPSCELAD